MRGGQGEDDHLVSIGLAVHASDGVIVHRPAVQLSISFVATQNCAPSLNDRPAHTQPLSGSGIWAGAGKAITGSGGEIITSRGANWAEAGLDKAVAPAATISSFLMPNSLLRP
jgi:hypothetical protein